MKTQIISTEMLYATQRKKKWPIILFLHFSFSETFPCRQQLLNALRNNSHFQKTLKINQGGICYLRNSSSFKITDTLSEKVLTLKQKKGLWQMYVKKIENQSSNGWNKSCWCLHIISILYLFRTMRIKSLKEAEKLPGNLCY